MTDSRLIRLRAPGETLGIAGHLRALRTMADVIGALLMRELHTRYGRDNVGYLWLFLEPMVFGGVIGLFHLRAGGGHEYGTGVTPIAFSVAGYSNFIMFRGIVNRSEGALEANAPLLYHRQVTVLDLALAKALLELAGTFVSFTILFSLLILLGLAPIPARPLYIFVGDLYLFWFSFAVSMLVMAGAYELKVIERFVHVFTYFMIPLSGAFFMMSWMPTTFRDFLLWIPMPHVFEMIRFGAFESATDKYIDFQYVTGCCLVLTFLGLLCVKSVRRRIHLN